MNYQKICGRRHHEDVEDCFRIAIAESEGNYTSHSSNFMRHYAYAPLCLCEITHTPSEWGEWEIDTQADVVATV